MFLDTKSLSHWQPGTRFTTWTPRERLERLNSSQLINPPIGTTRTIFDENQNAQGECKCVEYFTTTCGAGAP